MVSDFIKKLLKYKDPSNHSPFSCTHHNDERNGKSDAAPVLNEPHEHGYVLKDRRYQSVYLLPIAAEKASSLAFHMRTSILLE
jgi:hypothetical protein